MAIIAGGGNTGLAGAEEFRRSWGGFFVNLHAGILHMGWFCMS